MIKNTTKDKTNKILTGTSTKQKLRFHLGTVLMDNEIDISQISWFLNRISIFILKKLSRKKMFYYMNQSLETKNINKKQ
jgi:hypothetical protein